MTSYFRFRNSLKGILHSSRSASVLNNQISIKDTLKSILEDSYFKSFDHPTSFTIQTIGSLEYGDYQCNNALSLAKKLKMNPKEVASTIIRNIDLQQSSDFISDVRVDGPGFINIRLSHAYLKKILVKSFNSFSGLGLDIAPHKKQKVIIDYSSPNVAKEMHVGHLRSTVIGECLARVMTVSGHHVQRVNHVGDWGTQFGMLILHCKQKGLLDESQGGVNISNFSIADLSGLYKESRARFDSDEEFQRQSRLEVVKLQAREEHSIRIWTKICEISRYEFNQIYSLLGIEGLEEMGESCYSHMLGDLVSGLRDSGCATESEGAIVVPSIKENLPPMLLQKSDGGYLYSTTDLAAIKHRVSGGADRILYVVDNSQKLHFDAVFDAARRCNILPSNVEVRHVGFGLVLGEDGKRLKSRSGDVVKLKTLLEEAAQTCREDLEARLIASNRQYSEETIQKIVRVVSINAVKYADLSMRREGDYKFSYKKMLSLTGNTAPYLMYSYARICGIVRNCKTDDTISLASLSVKDILIETESEVSLCRHLVRFEEVIQDVALSLYPHILCEYLYDLSHKFNSFYEKCEVSRAQTEEVKCSRLAMCHTTAGTLKAGMQLLGLETVEEL